ncbi:MAG: tetratricopeptide repeat protein [Alphaproteobacteria bacterium]|uniref:Tetratricopeptide repeat protein n=1 Tax=Candidatus Nitrobium versatile TaxID=2884831 RepID=A0A953J3A3_9BACT|nr:tetratricopeptide repeat protein [Candidatus Nitrobium versatile]
MKESAYLEKLREQVRKRPSSRLFLSLAEELRRRDREEEAFSLLREGVKRNPGFGPGHVALGRHYLSDASFQEAKDEFLEALRISPRSLPARKGLAEAYKKLGQEKEAAGEYKRVLELDPYDPEAAACLDSLERAPEREEMQETAEEGARKAELSTPLPAGEEIPEGAALFPGRVEEGERAAGGAPVGEALWEADCAIAEGRYRKAMGLYTSLLALHPDDRNVLQRREELRALLKLTGEGRERAVEHAVERLQRLSGAIRVRFALYQSLGRKERTVYRLACLSDAVRDRFVLYLAAGRKEAVASRLAVFLDTIKSRFPLKNRP